MIESLLSCEEGWKMSSRDDNLLDTVIYYAGVVLAVHGVAAVGAVVGGLIGAAAH